MTETTLSNLLAWSVQAGAICLAAIVLSRLVPVDAPGVRYMWWRVVLVICLALPAVQPRQTRSIADIDVAPVEASPLVPADAASGSSSSRLTSPRAASASLPPVSTLVAAILAGGTLVRLGYLGLGLAGLRRLRAAGRPAEASGADDELAELRALGADVRYVPSLRQPVTFGVRRPVVLLPESLHTMPQAVQRAVVTHELWHVRRRDWVWTVSEEALRAALWFHPAIWHLISRVQAAREEVVDELSVLATSARRSYLEALLAFADEPAVYPAAPFIRRRQLFTRMWLISREAVMSPRRIVGSIAGMTGALLLVGWYSVAAFPLTGVGPADGQQAAGQARDPRPGVPRPETAREQALRIATTTDPTSVSNWLELARLQEERGASDEAAETFSAALRGTNGNREVLMSMARFFTRAGDFEKAIAALEDAAAANPTDPTGHQLVATYYWEKAQKDQRLSHEDRQRYIEAGIAATDRALAQRSDYVEALTYKNILLRMQANVEADPSRRDQLLAEADALRNRAMELSKQRAATAAASTVPVGAPPPPPPPPRPEWYNGQQPVRVGGNIKTPTKIRDARPIYPPEALSARVSGLVILEAVIDVQGNVAEARVLRSIPLLDQAARDAVMQWQFTPTLLNGVPVPVIMTVTVNFTVQ